MPRAIGFWFSPHGRWHAYPRPHAFVDPTWEPQERDRVVAHLRAGAHYETYRSWEWCRFGCGVANEVMGHSELTDGRWVWPEGLVHYVELHAVRLPVEFVESMREGHADATPPAEIDDTWWTEHGRARGASIDLSEPWRVVTDYEELSALNAELAREIRPGHVLAGLGLEIVARRIDRDDVLAAIVGDPRLAVVHLTRARGEERPPAPMTRVLAGWHEWNASREDDS